MLTQWCLLIPSARPHVRALRGWNGIFSLLWRRKFESSGLSMPKVILDNRRSDTLNTSSPVRSISHVRSRTPAPLQTEPVPRRDSRARRHQSRSAGPPLGETAKRPAERAGGRKPLILRKWSLFRRWREAAEPRKLAKPLRTLLGKTVRSFVVSTPWTDWRTLRKLRKFPAKTFREANRIVRLSFGCTPGFAGGASATIVTMGAGNEDCRRQSLSHQLRGAQELRSRSASGTMTSGRLRHGECDDRGRHHRMGRESGIGRRGVVPSEMPRHSPAPDALLRLPPKICRSGQARTALPRWSHSAWSMSLIRHWRWPRPCRVLRAANLCRSCPDARRVGGPAQFSLPTTKALGALVLIR